MLELLSKAVDYLVDHGGILGALVVVFGVLIVWQYLEAKRERKHLQARIEQLQQGTDPERVALRTQIAELQERRVYEANATAAQCKLAIDRVAHGLTQVSEALGEQTGAIQDFENLVKRKRS